MLFVGIDLALAQIDIAGVTPDGDWCFATVPVTKDPIPGRYLRRDFREHVGTELWDQVACVWIEEPFYNRQNPATFGKLSALKGAVAAAIPQHIVVDSIRPAAWRVEVGIPGNAKRADAKQAATRWLHDQLGHDAGDHTVDQAEAACIAWTCLRQSERASRRDTA